MQGAPPPAPAPARPARTDAQRAVRYNHLIGRLRDRQITMEEATELFGMMQAMLRASEAARLSGLAPPVEGTAPRPRPKPATAPVGVPMTDDMMLAGFLALGAGTGLLAAIAKRMAEGAAAAPAARPSARSAPR